MNQPGKGTKYAKISQKSAENRNLNRKAVKATKDRFLAKDNEGNEGLTSKLVSHPAELRKFREHGQLIVGFYTVCLCGLCGLPVQISVLFVPSCLSVSSFSRVPVRIGRRWKGGSTN